MTPDHPDRAPLTALGAGRPEAESAAVRAALTATLADLAALRRPPMPDALRARLRATFDPDASSDPVDIDLTKNGTTVDDVPEARSDHRPAEETTTSTPSLTTPGAPFLDTPAVGPHPPAPPARPRTAVPTADPHTPSEPQTVAASAAPPTADPPSDPRMSDPTTLAGTPVADPRPAAAPIRPHTPAPSSDLHPPDPGTGPQPAEPDADRTGRPAGLGPESLGPCAPVRRIRLSRPPTTGTVPRGPRRGHREPGRRRLTAAVLAVVALVAVGTAVATLPMDTRPETIGTTMPPAATAEDLAQLVHDVLAAPDPTLLGGPVEGGRCLAAAGVTGSDDRLLGARATTFRGLPAVAVVLASAVPDRVRLVVVDAGCGAGHVTVFADRVVPTP